MRADPEHARERAQELEGRELGALRGVRQRDRLAGVRFDPLCCAERSPSIGGRDACSCWLRSPSIDAQRAANKCAASSTPKSLAPSAAACTSSPNTISSASGGRARVKSVVKRALGCRSQLRNFRLDVGGPPRREPTRFGGCAACGLVELEKARALRTGTICAIRSLRAGGAGDPAIPTIT
jgi:hypothetical protein